MKVGCSKPTRPRSASLCGRPTPVGRARGTLHIDLNATCELSRCRRALNLPSSTRSFWYRPKGIPLPLLMTHDCP